jgi:hypothetical protein
VESSVDSDDTIMREIDEVAQASAGGEDERSSPVVIILPMEPQGGTSSHIPSARSPPQSFEDFMKKKSSSPLPKRLEALLLLNLFQNHSLCPSRVQWSNLRPRFSNENEKK